MTIQLFTGDTLIVHTNDDISGGIGFVRIHTGGAGLISDQRRFGSKDTHVIDDKVVSIEVRRHVIDPHTEFVVVMFLQDREADLTPLPGRLDISRHVGRDIFPVMPHSVLQTLHGEREVRVRFAGLTTGVADIGGEEHLLSFAQLGLQRQSCHLSRRGHTVAVDHISVRCTSVLLHRIPISFLRCPVRFVRDTVHQTVLTEVREVGLRMQTVVRQVRCLRIAIAVRSVFPWQRMRIDVVLLSGFEVVEVQSFQHLIPLLNLLIGDKRFVLCRQGLFLQRSVLVGSVIDDLIPADIIPVITGHRSECGG